MNLSWTLSAYFAKRFLTTALFTFGLFLFIIYMIDLVELMRRGAEHEDISFAFLAGMALLDLPRVGNATMPFAVLFGAMACFLRLSRSNELVIARASGISVWQFLAPAIFVAFTLGVIVITIYNPISATMASRFDQLDATHLKGRSSFMAVSDNGLWLRQADGRGQAVIHATRISDAGLTLDQVIFVLYGLNDEFTGRIDAKQAVLRDGYWALSDLWIARPNQAPVHMDTFQQPTSLTREQVQESFANPNTISFWDLPRFIETAEAAGFTARRYKLHFYEILATPLLLCTMVLVGSAFSLRMNRFGGMAQLVMGGIFSGFIVYFLSDLSLALGLSGILPLFLAAWAPSLMVLFLGLAVLFHLEDG
ncbi:lipopolysaccharide export system permease protein [Parvibaculum indicum]|uniref:LPS export ABC transporter permease LptG n=1 Tax=Parvibaculum indicum TaxID=562969 RepID=UPI00141FAA81|nr:LPS export ABC transporter permease LptG [Parvibaculum indicum]NIJ43074.1 lipopolysaccharide export system permease protein [Parvibaculum indicum]